MTNYPKKNESTSRSLAHSLWNALKAIGRFFFKLCKGIARGIAGAFVWCRRNLSPRGQLLLLAVITALVIVGAALLFTGHGCTPATNDEDTTQQTPPPEVTYTPDEADLRQLSVDPTTISSFSLVESGNQMHAELSEDENRAITSEIAKFEDEDEEVGFLIVNLETGSGYCYNIDTEIYGASTYKAPLSLYLCEEFIDTDKMSRSAVSSRIENAIVWSDNDSYRSLKHAYEREEHNDWLRSFGIDPTGYAATFPTYSVRDASTLWMHTWEYLNSGSDTAEWLADLLSRTDVSFLREATEQAGMEYATVYDKGGWCTSYSSDENAVNDAGIVVEDDNVYLVVAFSDAPDSEPAERNLTALCKALLDARRSLDASSATWENVEYVEVAPADAEPNEEEIDVSYEIVEVPAEDGSSSSTQIAVERSSETELVVAPSEENRAAIESSDATSSEVYDYVVSRADGTSYRIAEVRR